MSTMSKHSAVTTKKRVTCKVAHPNAVIEELLQNFNRQIKDIDKKTALKIERALESLSKYPLPLSSGSDCAILQGFDKHLCEYINDQMTFKKKKIEHNTGVSQSKPSSPPPPSIATDSSSETVLKNTNKKPADLKDEQSSTNKDVNTFCKTASCNCNCHICKENTSGNTGLKEDCKQSRVNKPNKSIVLGKHNAILIALFQQQNQYPHREALTRDELILKAESYICKQHNKNEDTSWSVLHLLELKKRHIKVEMKKDIKLYSLTDLGRTEAQRLSNNLFNHRPITNVDLVYSKTSHDRVPQRAKPLTPPFINHLNITMDDLKLFIDMPPGTYDIVLLIDKNEPELPRAQDTNTLAHYESRSLKVGDVMWIARSKTDSQELVLPFILERKRMDDLAASIKDGRFHEQKFRLRKCGLRNVIYLIEDHKGNKRCGMQMSALQQAMANTRVQDGFMVHRTDSLKGTAKFLDMMTYRLSMELKNIHLRGSNTDSKGRELMTFEYFSSSSSKTKPLTVKELFIKMLLQLKGLSVEKALAITNKYNSPKALMVAYDGCSEKEGQLLLANLKFSSSSSKVGPNISNILYMLFSKVPL